MIARPDVFRDVTSLQGASDRGADPALSVMRGDLFEFQRDPILAMRRLFVEHGHLSALEHAGQRVYLAIGPDWNQHLLTDTRNFHARFFALRGPRHSAQRRLTSGLLTMNGEDHKRNRRMVMGPFQKKSIEGYLPALAGLAHQMLDGWRVGEVRDIFADMTQYMLRVTSSVLFGFDQTELAFTIGRMTERWMAKNHELGIAALVPDDRLKTGYEGLLALAEELEAQIRVMIDLRRNSPHGGTDVLSLLVRAHDESGVGMTDAELIGQAAVLFAAAHLTTANTLTWTLFLLAQHPRVAADLVDELDGALSGGIPTSEQLERLTLLDQVIKESMRVLPASAYSQRIAAERVEFGPFSLSRGSVVVFSPFMTHRLPELFPEADKFRPQRWASISPSPYAYLPFAAGPRMCLGASLAMMTLKVTLPAILQRYRLTVIPQSVIDGRVISTMLTPTSRMPMLISPPTDPFRSHRVQGNIHELMSLDPPSAVGPRSSRSVPILMPATAAMPLQPGSEIAG
jgi:cytochrome P450